MKTGDPSIFSQLVAHSICEIYKDDFYSIGSTDLLYQNITVPVKETCKKIVLEEFGFTEESFKDWHQDSIDDFLTACSIFIASLVTFYENIRVDKEGFYIPEGFLGFGKKRLSQNDLWGYYKMFKKDRAKHPLGNWRNITKEFSYPLHFD